jgi:hypothetical protein
MDDQSKAAATLLRCWTEDFVKCSGAYRLIDEQDEESNEGALERIEERFQHSNTVVLLLTVTKIF